MSAPLSPQCHGCFRPLAFDHASLEFFDERTDGYPDSDHPEHTLPRYACDECGSESVYFVSLAELQQHGSEGLDVWVKHLMRKRWFRYQLQWDLVTAYELAVDLRRIHENALRPVQMRSVVDSIPRRHPPTPKNPRNITATLRARVLERDAFKCRRCGCGATDARLVVDHIIAVAKGGTADFDNLQTLCALCNAGKSDREPHPTELRGATL